jgi:rhodanese-related sulfurtransferase
LAIAARIWASISRIADALRWPRRSQPAKGAPFRWMDSAELSEQLRHGGAIVVDVRGPDEFSGSLGHIPGAVNLPLQTLQGRIADLVPLKDKTICLVCHTDRRSSAAASLFSAQGFRDVGVLRGGMSLWRAEGLPFEATTEDHLL